MNAIKTLEAAKELLRNNLHEGATCPCCNQHVQMYTRPLTWGMMYGLILLTKAENIDKDPVGFIHVENYLKKTSCPSSVRGDLSKLRFWNFIQPMEGEREDSSPRNGYYKLLPSAYEFIHGHSKVMSHVKIYNNRFFGYTGKAVDIHDVIKKKFSYLDLMLGKL